MFKTFMNYEAHIKMMQEITIDDFFCPTSMCFICVLLYTQHLCLNSMNPWKKKLHDYYCQIMAQ